MAGRRRVDWDEEDEWVERDYHRSYGHVRGTPAPYPRASGDLLMPEVSYNGSSHRRSRSHGQAPAPHYTHVYVDQVQRNQSRSPSRDPRGRRGSRYDADVVDAIEDVAHEIRRGRSREPSQQPWRDHSPAYYQQMQLQLMREREHDTQDRLEHQEQLIRSRAEARRLREKIAEAEKQDRWKSEEERFRKQLELERMKEEMKRRDEEVRKEAEREKYWADRDREEAEKKMERDRIWREKEAEDRAKKDKEKRAEEDLKLRLEHKEIADKAERERVIAAAREADKKKKDSEKAAQDAAVAAWRKKEQDDKEEKEKMRQQFKIEEETRKLKEKEEREEWKRKIEKEEADKKAEAKKKEEELEEEMRKRLSRFGFQANQIDVLVDPKQAKKPTPGQVPSAPIGQMVPFSTPGPTFIKVHRKHIDVETLRYYNLPWEYAQDNNDYIVILQEMDSRETDILFEHTRKLRRGHKHLLIEARGRDHAQYAFVRRRAPSASPARRKSSPKRVSLLFG